MTGRTARRVTAAVVGGVLLVGIIVFLTTRDRADDRRAVRVAPPPTTPATTAPAPSPPSPATVAVAPPVSQPVSAATAPVQSALEEQLSAAQQQAVRAHVEFRAAREAVFNRLAQQPGYQQAKRALQEAEAKVAALRQANEQPALTTASQDWIAKKNAVIRMESAALNGDAALRTAAGRVAAAANQTTALQQQIAERDAAERERQETAARTARAVEAAIGELADRARTNLQLLVDRGVIESVDPRTGDVRVDPFVWEPMNPQTREAVALAVRQAYQADAARAERPPLSHFRIISSRDDDTVFATYPVHTPPAATAPST